MTTNLHDGDGRTGTANPNQAWGASSSVSLWWSSSGSVCLGVACSKQLRNGRHRRRGGGRKPYGRGLSRGGLNSRCFDLPGRPRKRATSRYRHREDPGRWPAREDALSRRSVGLQGRQPGPNRSSLFCDSASSSRGRAPPRWRPATKRRSEPPALPNAQGAESHLAAAGRRPTGDERSAPRGRAGRPGASRQRSTADRLFAHQGAHRWRHRREAGRSRKRSSCGRRDGIVVITQLDPMAVVFTLPQDDLPRIARRMSAGGVAVDAYSRDGATRLATGKLLLIDNQINQATATVRLKATFPNPDKCCGRMNS